MFLAEPPRTEESAAAYAEERDEIGYVGNDTRLWSWRPGLSESFFALRAELTDSSTLTERDVAVLVSAAVSARGDAYCSFAWGPRLAALTDAETAANVLSGRPAPALSERETALAEWARQVVRDPNGTASDDVARLHAVGLTDREIFEATAYIAFRLALATINDALGAAPDRQLADAAPQPIRDAVTFGRAPSTELSPA